MLKNEIMDVLRDMDDSTIVCVWNEYCDSVKYYDDRIYFMGDLDDLFYGCSASDLLRALDSDFSLNDDYFRETIYGLSSFDCVLDYIDLDDLADYIVENDEDFGYNDIREALDEKEAA